MSTTHPPFVAHDPKHIEPQRDEPRRAAVHTVPDLRFEYGFLKSIRPHFSLQRPDFKGKGKGKGKEKETDTDVATGPVDRLDIQWLNVVWITTRDQVLSPLAQGALWALASYFLTPVVGQVRSFVPSPPEGGVVKWLRGWVHSLVTPQTTTTKLYGRP